VDPGRGRFGRSREESGIEGATVGKSEPDTMGISSCSEGFGSADDWGNTAFAVSEAERAGELPSGGLVFGQNKAKVAMTARNTTTATRI